MVKVTMCRFLLKGIKMLWSKTSVIWMCTKIWGNVFEMTHSFFSKLWKFFSNNSSYIFRGLMKISQSDPLPKIWSDNIVFFFRSFDQLDNFSITPCIFCVTSIGISDDYRWSKRLFDWCPSLVRKAQIEYEDMKQGSLLVRHGKE